MKVKRSLINIKAYIKVNNSIKYRGEKNMSRSESLEKKGSASSSPGQSKSANTALSQEILKGLQISFQEMITPLSVGLSVLTE